MKQLSFTDAELNRKGRVTRRARFLAEMDRVVPWSRLEALIAPVYPKGLRGRTPYPLSSLLRCYLMQNWFGFSDPAMEDALYEIASIRRFAGLDLGSGLPDETTLLKFRRRLETHELTDALFNEVNVYLTEKQLLVRKGSMIDATIIHAPSSTKNIDGTRDPEMHQTKKGNQYYFGAKAHIGADDESGLVHSLEVTAANTADVTMAQELLHGDEERVWADAGYTGAQKYDDPDARPKEWLIAKQRSKVAKMPEGEAKQRTREVEYIKSRVRARVEHVFRVLKCQFGYRKVRYRGLKKNAAQLKTLFALVNLYTVRRQLMAATG